MKICLFPHPNTMSRFCWLTGNLSVPADIEICFPEENLADKKPDIVILEEASPKVTEPLLSIEKPPVIVIPKAGTSNKSFRYLPDFSKEFPKLLQEISEQTSILRIIEKHKTYYYHQEDIVYLKQDGSLCIRFRQGNSILLRKSLSRLSGQLSERIFFPVGTDLFVNIAYVSNITAEGVYLQNGQSFSVSADEAETVKNAFFKTKYLSSTFCV